MQVILQAFISHIPSQIHASSIALWWVILFLYYLYFQQQIESCWLIYYIGNMTCVSRMFDSQIYKMFPILIP